MESKPPFPPFTELTAAQKVQAAENASINDLPIKEAERKFRWERA